MSTELKALPEQVNQAAADWFSLMQSGNATEQQKQELTQWLEQNDDHALVYQQLEKIWQSLSDMRLSSEAQALKRSVEREPNPVIKGFFDSLNAWIDEHRTVTAGLASMSIAAILLLSIFVFPSTVTDNVPASRYVSEIGEIKSVLLADNSRVELGAKSEIRVRITEDERRIELVRGEVFFDVTSDLDRPFYVKVGEVSVRVVGTQFDVRKRFSGVSVSVLEGIVDVTGSIEQPESAVVQLTAGQKIVKPKSQAFSPLENVSKANLGAWRQGRLIYQNADLIDVVSDANRYFDGNISLQTKELFHEKVTVTLRTDQIGLLPDMLSQALSLTTHELPGNRIVIGSRMELVQP